MKFCEHNFATTGIIVGVATYTAYRMLRLTRLRRHEPECASYNSDSSDLQPESTASEPAVVSLFNRLRAPQKYELTRKHTSRRLQVVHLRVSSDLCCHVDLL